MTRYHNLWFLVVFIYTWITYLHWFWRNNRKHWFRERM